MTARLGGVVVACILATLPLASAAQTAARPFSSDDLRELVRTLRTDPRGPYQSIRWYCKDGTSVGPQQRCPQAGGIQHASFKDVVIQVRDRNRLYLGQILAGTDFAAFLDADHRFSRARQYQVGLFLERVDGGWVRERAQYYRGAVQAEDEEAWGRDFLRYVLGRNDLVLNHFYWVRELVRDIPHAAGTDLIARIRARAADVALAYPAFADLRVKIHGQPDAGDLERVRAFAATHSARTGANVKDLLRRLETDLDALYSEPLAVSLEKAASLLPAGPLADGLRDVARRYDAGDSAGGIERAGALLATFRSAIEEQPDPLRRLNRLDASLRLEDALFRMAAAQLPSTPGALLRRSRALGEASVGTGMLAPWEFEAADAAVDASLEDGSPTVSTESLRTATDALRRMIEWSVSTVQSTFGEEINRFAAFEPLANGFVDDRLRGSVLLQMGEGVSRLAELLSAATGQANQVLDIPGQDRLRGVNPGFAVGELVVITGDASHIDFDPEKVYVLERPPAELKPVSGILSVSEGNVVSHVQLLARNLGIPNVVIAPDHVRALAEHAGHHVFLAVSPRGIVRMKPSSAMTAEERALVETRSRDEERIRVPTSRLALDHMTLTSLADLRASDSGRLCGPKAANLGQLKSLFPERVANGFIVPFGVFRAHMEQAMPGTGGSYWDFLRETFRAGAEARAAGRTQAEVDSQVLGRLATLRDAISKMPLLPAFVLSLRSRITEVLGQDPGAALVFVRSDTNMEDLADFTGAGLNQTVPNVKGEMQIQTAIRQVWASPYRERSYAWRQRYLENPEDVYPSILILESVNVELSGVMITTGIASMDPEDLTVAFNRGVGGAVDGQAAETYLLRKDGSDVLLAPAREPTYRELPSAGGIAERLTPIDRPLLSSAHRAALRAVGSEFRRLLPGTPGIESDGPFDIELGFFSNQVRLFQVRPFVENRSAGSTTYLHDMDGAVGDVRARISLTRPISR